ncbi:MAG: isoprenyl transferase [Pseudomonadota bacterium]
MVDTSSISPPVPEHVAIIMDGNGRWATARNMPRVEGHRRGAEAVKNCVETAKERGVKYLTLFAFSSENWKRPEEEVSGLMNLLRFYMKRETAEIKKSGIRLEVIGERERLDSDIRDMINQVEEVTAENEDMVLIIALSYGGRNDIVNAARTLAQKVNEGTLSPENIDETAFQGALMTARYPDPDLVIRTSGEYRLSNFLMWQLAYSEIYFTPVLWPDFSEADFDAAVEFFNGRERRFGALSGGSKNDIKKQATRNEGR